MFHARGRRLKFVMFALRAIGWLGAGLAGAPASPQSASPAMARPNFVIIRVDDLRWDDLAIAGHPFAETPAIDSLARGGVQFLNAFAATPCARRAVPAS